MRSLFARSDPDLALSEQRYRATLDAALQVSDIAASAMAFPDAVQAMLRSATGLLSAEQGSIMLLEPDGSTLVLSAAHGLPAEVAVGRRQPVGESVAGRVLATAQPLLLGQIDDGAFVNFVAKSRPIPSSVVVPLRVHGRPIGVLSLGRGDASAPFVDEDVRVAQMFGDQAAGVIHRARLHERAEERSSELMALVDAGRGLLGTLDLDEVLQKILDGATRLSCSTQGFACVFDAETSAIARGVFRGMDKKAIAAVVAADEVKRAIDDNEVCSVAIDALGKTSVVALRTGAGTRGVVACLEGPIAERTELLRAFAPQCSAALSAAELHAVVERKETELSSIIQGVPNAIVLADAHGRIVAINPAAEEVFSLSASFSAGAPVLGSLGHEELEQLLTGDGETQTEVTLGSPPRTYKARVTQLRRPGAASGRVLMMDDVTSEREMMQIQRDFVAMIGHELRTPLTIVKGFARTLLRRLDNATKKEAREALETIDGRAAQLERLIEDLLYVSRIEARETSLRIDKVDIAALVRAVGEDLVEEHQGRELLLEIADSLVWPCDETKLRLVLRHLIENGLKYSHAPDPVKVRAYADDDELRVDVVDRGPGIVSSDIPHIFERFRQLDGSSTRAHGGTGTGLYLCAQLIRVHGGHIWVDSTWGKGSTFSFSLPRRSTGSEAVRIHGRKRETA